MKRDHRIDVEMCVFMSQAPGQEQTSVHCLWVKLKINVLSRIDSGSHYFHFQTTTRTGSLKLIQVFELHGRQAAVECSASCYDAKTRQDWRQRSILECRFFIYGAATEGGTQTLTVHWETPELAVGYTLGRPCSLISSLILFDIGNHNGKKRGQRQQSKLFKPRHTV